MHGDASMVPAVHESSRGQPPGAAREHRIKHMMKERNELATPALSGLLDFWLTKSTEGAPLLSSSISPADLRPWKDNIVIFEVIGDDDFVYSYYGKALAEAFGHSRLGATLDQLPEEQRAMLRHEYASARRERLPVARVYTADFNGVTRSWERLVLPMSSDGLSIDKLLVAAYELSEKPIAETEGDEGDAAKPAVAVTAEAAGPPLPDEPLADGPLTDEAPPNESEDDPKAEEPENHQPSPEQKPDTAA